MFVNNYILIGIIALAVIVVLFLVVMILKSSKSKKKVENVVDISQPIPEFSDISQSSNYHFSEQDFNRKLMSEQQGVDSIVDNDVQSDVVDIISDSEIVQEPVVSNVVLSEQPAESNFIPNVQSFSNEGPGFVANNDFNVVSGSSEQQVVSNNSGVAAFDNFFVQPVQDNTVVQSDSSEPEIIDDI